MKDSACAAVMTAWVWTMSGCGAPPSGDAPESSPAGGVQVSGVGVSSSELVETSPSGFSTYQWNGDWGSDGPIYTGDLNGDGLTDVFMWRDSSKDWSVNLSTGSGFIAQRWQGDWATDADTPSNVHVCDLNADGYDDVFMFRASSNDWSVNLSNGFNNFIAQRWGGAWGTDGAHFIGNFDGDTQPNGKHRCDILMARTWAGDFTVNISTGTNFVGQVWAGGNPSTDGPVHVGDVTGDGKTDVFMFKTATNNWSVNVSAGNNFTAQHWGGDWGTDGPIFVGDLDGDGDDDVFMWRAAMNWWSVNLSTRTNFIGYAWQGGCGSDGPAIVGDFDGNGKKDIMMWRDGFKQWVVNLSTGSGFNRQIWNGDWGSDGPILSGRLDAANWWGNTTDVFMWRDPIQKWSINLSNIWVGPPGANATTPGCGAPAWENVGPDHTTPFFNVLPIAGRVDDIQISTNYDGSGQPAMYVATTASGVNGANYSGGGGGVWRSANWTSLSPTWTPLLDHLPGLTDTQRVGIMNAISIGIHPTSPQTLYAGINTSPPELLKSPDGGNTWSIMGAGQVGNNINRVMVDPNGVIYVASSNGLFVKEPSDTNFTNVAAIPLPGLSFIDVAGNYFGGSFTVFAAASNTGIYTLAKVNGTTWTFTQNSISLLLNMQQQAFTIGTVGQIRFGNVPGTPAAGVVAVFRSGGSIVQIYRVTQNQNGTFTWAPQFFPSNQLGEDWAYNVGNGPAMVGAGTAPDGRAYFGATGIAQQYGVSNAVNIQDTNSPYVLGPPNCGGSKCTAHVDTHAILYSYLDQKMYFGTDGGVFRFLPTPNTPGATWDSANSDSLKNMLSFSLSASPTQPNVLVVGHQDNGIAENASGSWSAPTSAAYNNEGDQVFFDPNDPSGSTVYAFDGTGPTFQKSTDSGVNFSLFSNLFVPPLGTQFLLAFHPTQFNRFMVVAGNGGGGCNVQEAIITNGNPTLTNLSPPIASCPTAIGYAGNKYYVATFNGTTALFQAPVGPFPTWTSVWGGGNPQSPIVSILADNANANSIYLATASAAGRVFFKPDVTDGTGWTLGAGLKELTGTGGLALQFPVAKLALTPSYGRTPTLYAATVAGLFQAASLNGNSTAWTHLGVGLADSGVADVRTDPVHHGVYAALFGRGAWTLTDWSAATDIVGNAGFESGNLNGWTASGSASIVGSSHGGYYAAQVGSAAPTIGDSTIFQVISVPPGATTIRFSYLVHCPDTIAYDWAKASFVDNITKVATTILAPTCTNTGNWVTVSAPIGASAGHSITLMLTSHDDDYVGDETYTWFDDVTVF
jgi:FG-GAP-like repeat